MGSHHFHISYRREKPSCIVPGVPRTEASVKCLAKPEPRTPATAAREVIYEGVRILKSMKLSTQYSVV